MNIDIETLPRETKRFAILVSDCAIMGARALYRPVHYEQPTVLDGEVLIGVFDVQVPVLDENQIKAARKEIAERELASQRSALLMLEEAAAKRLKDLEEEAA